MNNNFPRVSIITVCYNAVSAIQRTILSVLSQTYENIEYIIIDGKSTDGTLAIIKKYESRISFWLSEPDNGIYDAMNKAINNATGEWVLFMNADDEFVDNKVVERFVFVVKTHKNYAVYYGDTILRYAIGDRPVKALGLKSMRYMMAFSHQSVFIRTDLMKGKKYSLKYKLASDYDFLLSIYLAGERFYYLKYYVSRVRIDAGASFSHFIESKKEVLQIHKTNGYGKWEAYCYYWKAVLRFRLSNMLKSIIPKGLIKLLLKIE